MGLLHRVDHGCRIQPVRREDRTLFHPRRIPMDYGFLSHALLWLIGAMAALGALLTAGALWSMGRANYRKD